MISEWFANVWFFSISQLGLIAIGVLAGRAGLVKKVFGHLSSNIK